MDADTPPGGGYAGAQQKIERPGSTLWASNPSVLPVRPTKGATVTYSRKLEHTSTNGATPNPHNATLTPGLTPETSKPLENRKKTCGKGHQKPSTNPSHERESREGQPPPLEDAEERARMGNELWAKIWPLAARLIDERSEARGAS